MSFGSLTHTTSVAASSEEVKDYVPPNGEVINIYSFKADGQYTDGMASLVWDRGGQNEEIIWASTGAPLPFEYEATGDGVKKLSLVLTNNHTSEVIMASYVEWDTQ